MKLEARSIPLVCSIVAACLIMAFTILADVFADAETYGRMKGTPAEVVTDATAAESLDFTAAITDRKRSTNLSPTVVVAAALSGSAGDTVVIYCGLYSSDGTFVGETHATAIAGAGLEATPATQITAAGGRTFVFAENAPLQDTLTVSSGSLITDGYEAGMTLTVASSSSNDGDYRIASLTATVITIHAADDFVDEGPISATTTLDASGDSTCNLIYLDTAGAVRYSIRHLAPSSGNVDLRWWSVGSRTGQ